MVVVVVEGKFSVQLRPKLNNIITQLQTNTILTQMKLTSLYNSYLLLARVVAEKE